MAHARKQIRDAVAAAVTGLATTADRVHPSRAHPLAKDHDPTLLVYTGREDVEADTGGRPVKLLRTLEVTVEGRAVQAPAADLEDTLDRIAAEVEAALGTGVGATPLGGLLLDLQLTAIEPEIDGSGETPVGATRIDFTAQYRTPEDDAENISN